MKLLVFVLSLVSTFAMGDDKSSFQPYGMIKLNSSYDSRASSVGDYMKWVNGFPNADPQFNMTANATRIGVRMKAPDIKDFDVSGLVEADLYSFQGGSAQEFKPGAQFRHAYVKVKYEEWGLSLLAGQTFDVIAPLNPDTINYSVLWWAGNVGYRRPQVRLTEELKVTANAILKVDVAAVRVIGHDAEATGTTPASTTATGHQSGAPGVQARVGFAMPILTEKAMEVGVSAYSGDERYSSNKDLRQTIYAGDLVFPILTNLIFKGEVYTGENTDTYNGGIGQGVSPIFSSVGAIGGWAQLGYVLSDRWTFNLGWSTDQAHEGDVAATTGRISNSTYFGNAFYNLTKSFQVGLEFSNWDTTYKAASDVQSTRTELAFTGYF